ncbi:MAG: phosphatase PAP2 family protein [Bacteroidetes bacterium]|nr:phosphatase PAP2 family protein [Bacteroidota bacterium]MCW5897146.1 phosphatase PAP2 family protein [Bacteroidota bacterium]
MNNSRITIARWISIIGHPFLLMPALTGIIAYHVLPPKQALIAELVALGVVIVPAAVYTMYRVRKGTWGDLDVSDQRQRGQFYRILLPLLLIVTIVALLADVPPEIPLGAAAIIVLVGSAHFINSKVKVSLHTGFGVFVALTLFLIRPDIAFAALILACLIGWSRIVLGRHSTREVLLGGGLGFVVAGALVLTLRTLN